nr:hypothetical protein CFP56_62526 [Quercus suber]
MKQISPMQRYTVASKSLPVSDHPDETLFNGNSMTVAMAESRRYASVRRYWIAVANGPSASCYAGLRDVVTQKLVSSCSNEERSAHLVSSFLAEPSQVAHQGQVHLIRPCQAHLLTHGKDSNRDEVCRLIIGSRTCHFETSHRLAVANGPSASCYAGLRDVVTQKLVSSCSNEERSAHLVSSFLAEPSQVAHQGQVHLIRPCQAHLLTHGKDSNRDEVCRLIIGSRTCHFETSHRLGIVLESV